MSFVDNLSISDKIKEILKTSSDSWSGDGNSQRLFQESARELSSQINSHGIDNLNTDVSFAFINFIERLNDFLKDINKHQKQLHHDLTHPIRPTQWPSDDE